MLSFSFGHRQIRHLIDNQQRLDWLKNSLKEYVLINKNHYLMRSRRSPYDDDEDKCLCVRSTTVTP